MIRKQAREGRESAVAGYKQSSMFRSYVCLLSWGNDSGVDNTSRVVVVMMIITSVSDNVCSHIRWNLSVALPKNICCRFA